jgi:hypothetical protein
VALLKKNKASFQPRSATIKTSGITVVFSGKNKWETSGEVRVPLHECSQALWVQGSVVVKAVTNKFTSASGLKPCCVIAEIPVGEFKPRPCMLFQISLLLFC